MAEVPYFAYSVKIERTAKGLSTPSVHVYSNDKDTAVNEAVEIYLSTMKALEAKGEKPAPIEVGKSKEA